MNVMDNWTVYKVVTSPLSRDPTYRCNLVGQDLNRAWADTNKFMHSEIVDIKKKLIYYDNHSKYDLGTVTPGPEIDNYRYP